MRTPRNNFFSLILLIAVAGAAGPAGAESLLQLDRAVTAFPDHAAEAATLLISEDGRADFLENGRRTRERKFRVAHRDCRPLSANTVSLDTAGGLTLAYPFLVGTDRICYLDESAGVLRLLARFGAGLPAGAFSAVYAGQNALETRFLINGREFPDARAGYIWLLTVNRRNLHVQLRELITDVPDFSGGMLFEPGRIWIGTYPGQLHRVLLADLDALIASGRSTPFARIAATGFSTGDGLNGFLLGNARYFLFDNGNVAGFESYLIEKKNGFRTQVKPPCPPVAGRGDGWLLLCNRNSLELWTPVVK